MVFATAFYVCYILLKGQGRIFGGMLPIPFTDYLRSVRDHFTTQHEVICLHTLEAHQSAQGCSSIQHKVMRLNLLWSHRSARGFSTTQHKVIHLHLLGSHRSAQGYLPLNTRSFIYICQGHIDQHEVILTFKHVIIYFHTPGSHGSA